MTVQEAVLWIDEKKHNVYSLEDKLAWLMQLEAVALAMEQRYGSREEAAPLESDSSLRIPAPHDQMYLRWLEAQIDYANQEYLQYNNAMALFNTLWMDYAAKYSREHLHAQHPFRLGGKEAT